ncbi:hypothetical protein HAX54_019358, partial [Datura stramonium]|nr:hypothetical protein [Datura stramonium]
IKLHSASLQPFERNVAKEKEGKSMDRPHDLHPMGTMRSPKDAFGIQGSQTDHRTLFNKWNALAFRSQVGQSGSEKGNDLFLKPAFLRPKSRAERGGKPSSQYGTIYEK